MSRTALNRDTLVGLDVQRLESEPSALRQSFARSITESNDYFSPTSPTSQEYFNITSFSARPEQQPLRAVAWADSKLRQFVGCLAPAGLGRKDTYEGPKQTRQ